MPQSEGLIKTIEAIVEYGDFGIGEDAASSEHQQVSESSQIQLSREESVVRKRLGRDHHE